jgi:hypothetical protein
MSTTKIKYDKGEMSLDDITMLTWGEGELSIDTPRTSVKVMGEGGIVDGFVFGPHRTSIDVEDAEVWDEDERGYTDMILDGTKFKFEFSIQGKVLETTGYLTTIKFDESGEPKCKFSAVCGAPTWK